MPDLSADIEAAIATGEREIGDLSALLHSTAARINALILCRTDLATLQAHPGPGTDLELARLAAKVQRLTSPAASAA